MTLLNSRKPLTNVTKSFILDVAGILGTPSEFVTNIPLHLKYDGFFRISEFKKEQRKNQCKLNVLFLYLIHISLVLLLFKNQSIKLS